LVEQDVTLSPASVVSPASMNGYDLIFLGSGVYAGGVGASIKSLMKQVTSLHARFALFTTHGNLSPGMYKDAFRFVRKRLEKGGSRVVGEFDCVGESKNMSIEQKRQMIESMPLEKRASIEEALKN
jgi:hypothetical protein